MIVALQMCSGVCADANIEQLNQQLQQLPTTRPLLVCLPESFLVFSKSGQQTLAIAKQSDVYIQQIAELCRQYDIWLAAGTLPIATNNKYLAASLLFNNQGDVVAQYNKMHLFDVDVADGTGGVSRV